MVFSLLQTGMVNPQEATKRILESRNITNVAKLLEMPEPQPDFDQQIKLQEFELKKQQQEIDTKIEQFKVAAQAARDEANSVLAMAKAQSEQNKVEVERIKSEYEIRIKEMDMQLQQMKTQGELIKMAAQAEIQNNKLKESNRKLTTKPDSDA